MDIFEFPKGIFCYRVKKNRCSHQSRRKSCSAVRLRFLRVLSASMASSSVHTEERIQKYPSIPAALQARASSVTDPARAIVLAPYFLPSLATPAGPLAHGGLPVETSFSGDNEICVSQAAFQVNGIQDQIDPGF